MGKDTYSLFGNIKKEPLCAIATLVDPVYRGKLCTSVQLMDATIWLTKLAQEFVLPCASLTAAARDDISSLISAAQRSKVDKCLPPDLGDEKLESGIDISVEHNATDHVADYLRQSDIRRQLCPLDWWQVNKRTIHISLRLGCDTCQLP